MLGTILGTGGRAVNEGSETLSSGADSWEGRKAGN